MKLNHLFRTNCFFANLYFEPILTYTGRRAQERNALGNLIRAVQTRDRETACIRIPRSLDGRMQGKL